MRKFILLFCLLLSSTFVSASDEDDLKQIRSLIKNDLSEAKSLALTLKEKLKTSAEGESYFRTNYLLGYIYKEEGDFGKAIIYYLESIRLAENSSADLTEDLISLYNRCAIIYRQFKAYDLATEYYTKGIALAHKIGDQQMINLLNFNLAGVYIDNELYEEALNSLNQNLTLAKKLNYKVDDHYNRIASVYLKLEDYEKALTYYSLLEDVTSNENYEMLGYLYHNMALAYEGLGEDRNHTENLYRKSIELKKQHDNNTILFSSYFDLGRFMLESGRVAESIEYFDLAIEIIDNKTSIPSEIDVYKLKANALFELERYNDAKFFEDAYAAKLNQYLELQENIQDSDKKYNMDLITKRYFDEVAKQERIASILFYSKLISGSLLALLLFTIGLNWYQKVKMRKGIVRELMALKVID
ncbi:tetratricopeptide repeat protein [Ekhidna sp.]|uniref:tetratricopeptide repeat protein n=1 Tax=Ekhidna sp. TaxID=2608089 RepID=UPI003516440B